MLPMGTGTERGLGEGCCYDWKDVLGPGVKGLECQVEGSGRHPQAMSFSEALGAQLGSVQGADFGKIPLQSMI